MCTKTVTISLKLQMPVVPITSALWIGIILTNLSKSLFFSIKILKLLYCLFALQMFKKLLQVWGSASALQHTSYDQHVYITKAILISISFLDQDTKATIQDGWCHIAYQSYVFNVTGICFNPQQVVDNITAGSRLSDWFYRVTVTISVLVTS